MQAGKERDEKENSEREGNKTTNRSLADLPDLPDDSPVWFGVHRSNKSNRFNRRLIDATNHDGTASRGRKKCFRDSENLRAAGCDGNFFHVPTDAMIIRQSHVHRERLEAVRGGGR